MTSMLITNINTFTKEKKDFSYITYYNCNKKSCYYATKCLELLKKLKK